MKKFIVGLFLLISSNIVQADATMLYCQNTPYTTAFEMRSDGNIYLSVYMGPPFSSIGAMPEAITVWSTMLIQAKLHGYGVNFSYNETNFRITGMSLATPKDCHHQ